MPKRLVTLTADIREQQQLVKNLHKAENKTYKTYVRARANLMSKKHHDVQNKKTKKWYNLWVNSVAELQALVVSACLWLLVGKACSVLTPHRIRSSGKRPHSLSSRREELIRWLKTERGSSTSCSSNK